MKNIKIKRSRGYLIQETSGVNYYLCRIVNEYKDKEKASEDLIALLTKNTSEEKLMGEDKV